MIIYVYSLANVATVTNAISKIAGREFQTTALKTVKSSALRKAVLIYFDDTNATRHIDTKRYRSTHTHTHTHTYPLTYPLTYCTRC